MEFLPVHLADIEITNAVRRQVGYFDLQQVGTRLEISAHGRREGYAEESGGLFAVDENTRAFTHIAQINLPIVSSIWNIHLYRITRRSGKALCFLVTDRRLHHFDLCQPRVFKCPESTLRPHEVARRKHDRLDRA